MELINATRMVAGYTMGLEPERARAAGGGRSRAPSCCPKPARQCALADEQLPLVMADTFTGEPGFSAPVYEVDFAPRKPACDVLLVGSAHAPQGRQVTRLRAGLRVGAMEKVFDVVGDRVWHCGPHRHRRRRAPRPFVQHADLLRRGLRRHGPQHEDPAEHEAFCPTRWAAACTST